MLSKEIEEAESFLFFKRTREGGVKLLIFVSTRIKLGKRNENFVYKLCGGASKGTVRKKFVIVNSRSV